MAFHGPSTKMSQEKQNHRKTGSSVAVRRMPWSLRNTKHLSLVALGLLVLQNTSLVLLMRESLVGKISVYLTSTAVTMNEVLKLAICCTVVYVETGGYRAFIRKLQVEVAGEPLEMAKLILPAVLYTVQNNLLYIALANLDAATYSVCYQSKILTTAFFSVILLNKRLTLWKWGSLLLLALGVALTQLADISVIGGGKEQHQLHTQSAIRGFICVLAAACTSGFSGVYFEMLLKNSPTSLWIRNIQMGFPSIILSLSNVYINDWHHVTSKGFFQGYNVVVVAVIILQAAGGLVVAVVVKYADNIRKSFATAVSIVVSCFLSTVFFDFRPNRIFMLGVIIVCVSVSMYSRPAKEEEEEEEEENLPLVHRSPTFNSLDLNRRRDPRRV